MTDTIEVFGAEARYRVDDWAETSTGKNGVPTSRAVLRKSYQGELNATSTVEILICSTKREGRRILGPDFDLIGGYVGQEVVSGTLGGKSGTFVVHHGGTQDGREHPDTFGRIVPGSATGELRGLRGQWTSPHDQPVVTLKYHFVADA
jgi:hypothetical protein